MCPETTTLSSFRTQRWIVAATFSIVLTVLSAVPAMAHVGLDAPNGGEVLEIGSTYTVVWHDVIPHGPANYDLLFSTTGRDGPYLEIVSNLTFPAGTGSYTFDWTVPDTPSDQVRVRVIQDNTGTDYGDTSDSDVSIVGAIADDSAVMESAQDATLYEGDGGLANGSGEYFFAGLTQSGAERRALLAFDIAGAIPAGSTITSVSLDLTMSRSISGAATVELRSVLESWGEGPSDASGEEGGGATAEDGDTTWVHRVFPDRRWSAAGGVFSGMASASQEIVDLGDYTFASTQDLVADVQLWLDNPESNFGWALVMPSPSTGSAKRFNSREHATPSSRPRLRVTFQPGTEAPTALFTFSPSNPSVGDLVEFTDQSVGAPTEWAWDFGDGVTSESQNASHVYSEVGTYSVNLTVSNANGSDSSTEIVTVVPDDEPELTELVLLPAVANAEGSGGAFFVTTADVHSAGSATAVFRVLWLPRDSDNSEPLQSDLYMLEPGESRRFNNLLAEVFGATDVVGAAAVMSGSDDVAVMSRTFNQTADGTFGQSLPGVAVAELIPAGTRARVLFLTENDDFRSNLGLVSGVGTPITVQWELFNRQGVSLGTDELELPAWGNTQLNRVLAEFAPIEAAYADVWTTTTGGAFTCYGSVLDEISSDPTTVLPRLP